MGEIVEKNDAPVAEKQVDDEEMDAWMNDAPAGNTEVRAAPAGNAYADLRQSSARLGASLRNIASTIDQRLQISATAKQIDESTNISSTVGQGVQKLGNVLNNIDQQYHVKETTTNTARTLDEKLRISQAASNAGSAIRGFDEKHRLSTQTVEALERGASMVEQKVAPPTAATPGVSTAAVVEATPQDTVAVVEATQ
jgi:hypothetical protein